MIRWFWRLWPHEHRWERQQSTGYLTGSVWTDAPVESVPIFYFSKPRCRRCGR